MRIIIITVKVSKTCYKIDTMAYANPDDPRRLISKRKHYLANKERYKQRAVIAKERMRDYIRTKKDRPCNDCGVKYPYYVMQFDHVGDKLYNIADLVNYNNYAKLDAEIAKCEIVCANCHMERTYRRGIVQRLV